MNYKKIGILLGMKDIQRLPNTPHHRGYNLLEHGLVVGMLFRWFAAEEDVAYDINVFDKVLLHDYVESVTGDLNACVKKFNETRLRHGISLNGKSVMVTQIFFPILMSQLKRR